MNHHSVLEFRAHIDFATCGMSHPEAKGSTLLKHKVCPGVTCFDRAHLAVNFDPAGLLQIAMLRNGLCSRRFCITANKIASTLAGCVHRTTILMYFDRSCVVFQSYSALGACYCVLFQSTRIKCFVTKHSLLQRVAMNRRAWQNVRKWETASFCSSAFPPPPNTTSTTQSLEQNFRCSL